MNSPRPHVTAGIVIAGCVAALGVGLVLAKVVVTDLKAKASAALVAAIQPQVEHSESAPMALASDPTLPPATPAWSPAGPDLTGRVTTAQGEPVSGAEIFIDAAGPRVGRGYT